MLLFLLHPRLYAHSFFNSKDIPFASVFMIALLLAHRAFDRDTPRAFLACGAGVGVPINLRIMGVMLFAAVLAMRALDFMQASSREERKHTLQTSGAFALAATLTLHAISPYLWADPLASFEGIATLARHPLRVQSNCSKANSGPGGTCPCAMCPFGSPSAPRQSPCCWAWLERPGFFARAQNAP